MLHMEAIGCMMSPTKYPPSIYAACQIRAGASFLENFQPTENCYLTRPFKKKHCPCILEGHLTTNPILSALHLQGLKSNIYVHFQVVGKSASTVQWTILDPCSASSENDPKLYTNFEFYEIDIHKHLKNI